MPAIGPIAAEPAAQLLHMLTTITEPLTETAARALVADNGWSIDADEPGEGLVASGPWDGGTEAFLFTFDDGQTPHFTVTAYAGLTDDPASPATAVDTFAMLVAEAERQYGPRTGEIISRYSRAWWTLPGQTISISRTETSATIMWATNDDHDDLIKSARESA